MPEVSFPPRNQCSIDDPTDGAGFESTGETPAAPEEPHVPLAFRDDWGTEGAGAGGSSGAGGRGSGGGSSVLVERVSSRDSCLDEALRAVGTCGAAAVVTIETGGLASFLALTSCAGALVSLDQCLDETDPSVK